MDKTPISPGALPYAVLPLKDIVVFPHMVVPLFVARRKSVLALEHVMREGKKILLVTQKSASVEDPTFDDIYQIGTLASVLQMLKLPDGTVKVLVEGVKRVHLLNLDEKSDFYTANAQDMEEKIDSSPELKAMSRTVVDNFEEYVKNNKKLPPEIVISVHNIEDPSRLSDTLSSYLTIKIEEKQSLLEMVDVQTRLEKLLVLMESETSLLQVEKQIRTRVKNQVEKNQREFYLNEQLKAIHKELGDEETKDEFSEFEDKIKNTKLTKEAHEKAISELRKLRNMSPMSAEATVVRNYLEWLLSLPWDVQSPINNDLKHAQTILDDEHYGLEKVKSRITEYLAVQARVGKIKGAILCLVGPPGVGKTSLAKSIASATGRPFIRISLGGVKDESEVRGHRRTYIGSMPGKIIQAMKKAKFSNPLILLDEIDKMGNDWRGDPASALLEVLDQEQNKNFNDHYLEVDYDLSNVMFLATSNSFRMPAPLLDRLEIISLTGYTEEEKIEIAKRHLINRLMEEHGLLSTEWHITDDGLRELVRLYTREAGVRNLEREIAKLTRKAVKDILLNKATSIKVSKKNLKKYAGVPKYRFGQAEENDLVGAVTGLAWTEVGGDLLTIESLKYPGKGKVTLTGKLGEVMQESIQAALSYVKSRCLDFGIIPPSFDKYDIHVHVPEGAIPKDGPSAGIAMCTSIVSTFSGIPVRKDVAMTGEVTLHGRVLPIGGLKEKLLAALRGGIKKVLIPQENEKDISEIPENVKKGLEIVLVDNVDQVLAHALVRAPIPVEWSEDMERDTLHKAKTSDTNPNDIVRH